METRLTITAQFISDGRSLGYEGERLERYVAEQKEDYEKVKKEEFEREKARFEREERLKAEAKAEEKARFEREEKAKREEHERWKERDAREEHKRKEEMELERMKEKSATAAGTATQAEVRPRNVLDKLDKSFQGMKEDDDLMAYLTHFEAVATRCKIDRKEWSLLLSYKLTTFLRNCMLRDSLFLNENYEEVRVVLLRHADINAETCRKRFHRVKPRQNDFRGFVTELRNALDHWLKMAEVGKTVEEVKELLVKDRILENV
ncbi:trichoplein keratin filament-binding protein-like [Biomphalaria glabrata]|uniref:Trichoplein keratin filament-binding protein-like n=1 Tax=Biomphalaria glabrata TaxID=6526 RepID=A0A9W3AQD6_BIOGL|nr:trichoplein keratin filament-binding protein-like [Biomphalaria glabrata]